jgi:hypothetical protein
MNPHRPRQASPTWMNKFQSVLSNSSSSLSLSGDRKVGPWFHRKQGKPKRLSCRQAQLPKRQGLRKTSPTPFLLLQFPLLTVSKPCLTSITKEHSQACSSWRVLSKHVWSLWPVVATGNRRDNLILSLCFHPFCLVRNPAWCKSGPTTASLSHFFSFVDTGDVVPVNSQGSPVFHMAWCGTSHAT